MKRGKCRKATKGARSVERVAKSRLSEILTIGDIKRKVKRNSDLLSPSVAFSDTFPEGDGKFLLVNNFAEQNITPVFYLSRLDFHFISSSHSPHRGKQVKKKLFTLKKTAFLSFFDRFAVFVCFLFFTAPSFLFFKLFTKKRLTFEYYA